MRLLHYILFVFLVLSTNNIYAQNITDLNTKRKKIEDNIKRLNSLISETEKSKKITSKDISLNKSKLNLKNQLINQIENEITFIEKQILAANNNIDSLTELLTIKNEEFAQVIQKSFKNRNDKYLLLYLLSSSSFNQSYIRLKFYKKIMSYQSEKLIEIKTIINERSIQTTYLQENVKNLKNKQNERSNEANKLKNEINEYNKKLKYYRTKENQLKQDLKEELQKAVAIEKQIKKLIEEERRKRNNDSKLKDIDIKLSKDFSKNYGLFPSPVKDGLITGTFGENNHPVLKGVKVKNNGIDINVIKGSSVYSIFDGEVSKIFNVPLSGIAIIVRHGNYLTVYSNLRNVIVKVGDKVNKLQKLGEIECGDAQNGNLHFELWNERNPENPINWLYEYK